MLLHKRQMSFGKCHDKLKGMVYKLQEIILIQLKYGILFCFLKDRGKFQTAWAAATGKQRLWNPCYWWFRRAEQISLRLGWGVSVHNPASESGTKNRWPLMVPSGLDFSERVGFVFTFWLEVSKQKPCGICAWSHNTHWATQAQQVPTQPQRLHRTYHSVNEAQTWLIPNCF